MKLRKFICLILAITMLAALVLPGCGGETTDPSGTGEVTQAGNETKEPNPDDPDSGKFRVGHGRVNITPSDPVPLAGYGNTDLRMSTGFLDYIYTTCIAITDENDTTMLLFAVDLLYAINAVTEQLKDAVSAAVGVPTDHIVVNATHSHSSIDVQSSLAVAQEWINMYVGACAEAARLAMADRLPAKMYWTTADLTGYNFIRHYFTDLGEGYSVNHTRYCKGTPVRHTYDANPTMFILKFEREGDKDVLLTNWRAHNVLTSSTALGGTVFEKTNISADFTGQIRANLEKKYDAYVAYLQGDSGDVVTATSLPESIEHQPPRDYKQYGREVCEIISTAIDAGFEEIQPGPIQLMEERFVGKSNKADLEHLDAARAVHAAWNETHNANLACAVDETHFIQSQYHAGWLLARPSLPEYRDFLIVVGRIGDFAFTMAPFETSCSNGNYVRENSPSKYTMVLGYSNENYGYLCAAEAYDYGCYETDITQYAKGVAEDLAARYVVMLNELYGK